MMYVQKRHLGWHVYSSLRGCVYRVAIKEAMHMREHIKDYNTFTQKYFELLINGH